MNEVASKTAKHATYLAGTYKAYEHLTQQLGLAPSTTARLMYDVGRFGHASEPGYVITSTELDGFTVYQVTD